MLPLREPPQQITPEQITEPHLSDRCHQLEVLVIEDAPDLLVGMQLLLTSWGCFVQAAANSEQALKIAANSASLNAIIADFHLPGSMDGLELIKTLRESCDAEIPAVLITGERKVDLIDQAEELGVEFIHKPLKAAELKLWLVSRAA